MAQNEELQQQQQPEDEVEIVEPSQESVEIIPAYPDGVIEEAKNRILSQSLYSEEGFEFGKDTFNPSTVFHDKSHAEWMGNLLANKESDTMKNLSVQPPKPSKMTYLLVLVAGIMLGVILVVMFTGGLFPSTSGGHNTTTSPFVPPLPTQSQTPMIQAGLSILHLMLNVI